MVYLKIYTMQALFKVVVVLVVGMVGLVLALLSPLLLLIYQVFETINLKRKPIQKPQKKEGFGLKEILSTANNFKF